MDLRNALAKNLSKGDVIQIVDYVGDNDDYFKKLITIYEGPYRITQRAAWPLTYCAENQPDLIKPYIGDLLNFLGKPGIHDAVKRNTIRMLQFINIPKKFHGRTMDICFRYLGNPKEAVAIRVFSMTVLANLTRHSPEIKRELRMLIEDNLPYASAAFMSRARRVLKSIED